MTILQWLAAGMGLVLGIYLAARLISAAYFKSKEDHERKGQHGTRR